MQLVGKLLNSILKTDEKRSKTLSVRVIQVMNIATFSEQEGMDGEGLHHLNPNGNLLTIE